MGPELNSVVLQTLLICTEILHHIKNNFLFPASKIVRNPGKYGATQSSQSYFLCLGLNQKLYADQRRQCQLISPPPPKCSVSCMLLQAAQSQLIYQVRNLM